MLDGYSVAHERDVLPENRTRRRRELERAIFYEADHGEGCQALRSARQRKACVDLVRDVVAAVRQPVRLHDLDSLATINTNDTREPRLRGNHVEFEHANGHRPDVIRAPLPSHQARDLPGGPAFGNVTRALSSSNHEPAQSMPCDGAS